MSEYVHPLISAIVRELPKAGEMMTDRKRADWLTAFEAILDVLYPHQNDAPKLEDGK